MRLSINAEKVDVRRKRRVSKGSKLERGVVQASKKGGEVTNAHKGRIQPTTVRILFIFPEPLKDTFAHVEYKGFLYYYSYDLAFKFSQRPVTLSDYGRMQQSFCHHNISSDTIRVLLHQKACSKQHPPAYDSIVKTSTLHQLLPCSKRLYAPHDNSSE
jgi:hypothetical protein